MISIEKINLDERKKDNLLLPFFAITASLILLSDGKGAADLKKKSI